MDTISWTGLSPLVAQSENAVLILSKLQEVSSGTVRTDSLPMRSYPNPWRGKTPLCFASLPEAKQFLEIRIRRETGPAIFLHGDKLLRASRRDSGTDGSRTLLLPRRGEKQGDAISRRLLKIRFAIP